MEILRIIKHYIEKIITYLSIILISSLVLFTFIQILVRNFFSISFGQLENIVRSEILWIAFAGAILTTLQGKHISIDILPRYLQGKAERILRIIISISASIICFVLTWYSISFIKLEMSMNSTIGFGIPSWIPELILPIGFILLALSFPLKLLDKNGKKKQDITG